MITVTLEASLGNTINSTKVQRQKTSKNVMAVSKFQKSAIQQVESSMLFCNELV